MTLVPAGDLAALIAARGITLEDALTAQAAGPQQVNEAAAPAPKSITLKPNEKAALRSVPRRIVDVELPNKPRLLTGEERAKLIPLLDDIKTAKAGLEKAENALKLVFHHHLDIDFLRNYIEPEDDEPTPLIYDAKGHLAIKGEVTAEGLGRKVTRIEIGGKSLLPTIGVLEQLEADGIIDHAAYLRMSVPTRDVDMEAVMDELAAEDGTDLLKKMAELVGAEPKGTQIRMANT